MLDDMITQVKLLWDEVRSLFKKTEQLEEIKPEDVPREMEMIPKAVTKPSDIPVAPTNSPEEIHHFMITHKELVHKLIVKVVSRAIEKNLSSIDLFRIGNTPVYARIDSEHFDMVLNDAQTYFANVEKFELAQECQHLRDKIKVNKFLKTV